MKSIPCFNLFPLAAAALLLAGFGCDRDKVKVYQADGSDSPAAVPPPVARAAMPATMPNGLPVPDNSALPPLKFVTPDGWKQRTLTEQTQMRVASFSVVENDKQADVSVIPMNGMAGGSLANVNRWRGQVGLAPITEEALPALLEKVVIAGQPADMFDLAGTNSDSGDAARVIASVLHRDDTAWFFKLTGDSELVEKNKPAFIAFLKSVEFGGLTAPSTMDLSQLPPSHPAIPGLEVGTKSAAVADSGDKPTWTVPAGWQEGTLTQFLIAKYVVTDSNDQRAEVNISSLGRDGGGLLANVNRWRGQLGLAPATAAEVAQLPTMDAAGVKATVVEFSGTNPRTGKSATLVGVIVPQAGSTWFYKLMGDAAIVSAQRDALMKFVQSAKYPTQQ
jgi:hypothetical protein